MSRHKKTKEPASAPRVNISEPPLKLSGIDVRTAIRFELFKCLINMLAHG